MTESEGLPEEASTAWWQLVDEAETLAAEYREGGREAVVVHAGDVTPVDSAEYFGLNVLAPDSEYDRVRSLVAAHEFDRSHVYRRIDNGLRFFLCVFESTEDDVVVLVPVYATDRDLERLYHRARDADEMPVHVRPLKFVEHATLTVADPDLFFSGEE